MRVRLASDPSAEVFSAEFIQWLHAEFYSHIPMEEWTTTSTSGKALSAFCEFFLRQVLDQIEFMIGLIEPETLMTRIGRYFQFERTDLDSKLRDHMSKLVGTLCIRNEVGRGEAEGILGLKVTATRKVIRESLKEGLIQSPTEKGPLRIAFPVDKVIDYYFPRLFTDLPVSS